MSTFVQMMLQILNRAFCWLINLSPFRTHWGVSMATQKFALLLYVLYSKSTTVYKTQHEITTLL